MNLVAIFKKKKRILIQNRLLKFGIDLNEFVHESYRSANPSFCEKSIGLKKFSEGMYHDANAFFDFVKIEDFENTSRIITLSSYNNGEQGIKIIVDKLYRSLGEDKFFRTSFSLSDQWEFKQSSRAFTIRYWNSDDCNIELFSAKKDGLILLNIRSN